MKSNSCFRGLPLLLFLGAVAIGQAQSISVTPNRASGIYKTGETVEWTVEWTGPEAPPAAQYQMKQDGMKVVGEGKLQFDGKLAKLQTRFDKPGAMLVEVRWSPENNRNRASGGAVASPERIVPAAPPPKDFDAFWKSKVAELKKVPLNAKLEPKDSGQAGVAFWKVTLDNIRGTHVQGQLARPEAGTKFPAMLIVQWAGVYALDRSWVMGPAKDGWLVLDIQAHDIPIDEPAQFYRDQAAGPLRNYWEIGNDDREQSYFLRMYLSAFQALEYLRSRSDWDGKTLVVMGGSQGGHQTLMLAGLHPEGITAALALVPSGCDMLAPTLDRAPAFPQWYWKTDGKDPAKVRETSRYFDVANFARRIKCPVLVGIGLRDDVCPPATIFAAANQIRSRKEIVVMPKAGHQNENGSQADYYRICYSDWLPALRAGKAPPISGRGAGG